MVTVNPDTASNWCYGIGVSKEIKDLWHSDQCPEIVPSPVHLSIIAVLTGIPYLMISGILHPLPLIIWFLTQYCSVQGSLCLTRQTEKPAFLPHSIFFAEDSSATLFDNSMKNLYHYGLVATFIRQGDHGLGSQDLDLITSVVLLHCPLIFQGFCVNYVMFLF